MDIKVIGVSSGVFEVSELVSGNVYRMTVKDEKAIPYNKETADMFYWATSSRWEDDPERYFFEAIEDYVLNSFKVLHYSPKLGAEVLSHLVGDSFFVSLDMPAQIVKGFDIDAERYLLQLNSFGFKVEEIIFDEIVDYCQDNGLTLPYPKVNIEETEAKIKSGLEIALSQWFKEQSKNPFEAFYLYGRRSRRGELVAMPIIATDKPSDEWFLVSPERVSPSLTPSSALGKLLPLYKKAPVCNPFM